MRDDPGREGWRGAESRQWQSGRGEYTSYGSGGGRDWRRDEGGHGRGDYGRGEYGSQGREAGGHGEYGRESAGMGGYGRELGYGSGGLGAATYRGSSAYGAGEHERYGGSPGRDYGRDLYGRDSYDRDSYGRDYGRDYGRESGGRYEGRDEDRGPLERLGDRFREGMRHLTGKGPKGFHRSDERIRDDVCERIARSGLDAEDVEVKVEHGEVTLSGTVRHRDDKRRLEDVAEEVFGVDEVHNAIRVRREEQRWTTGQTITSSGQGQGTQAQGGAAQGGQRTQGTTGTSATTSSQPGAPSR